MEKRNLMYPKMQGSRRDRGVDSQIGDPGVLGLLSKRGTKIRRHD